MNLFFQHWEDVNAALGSALVLTDGPDIAGFEGLLDLVQQRISETSTALFAAANLKGALDAAKANLISWTVIFNATVRADHGRRSVARNLVPAPQQPDWQLILSTISIVQMALVVVESHTGN